MTSAIFRHVVYLTPVVLTREGSPNWVCKQIARHTPKKITTFPMMRVSTGIPGLDQTIDMLRLGDNVVWQVQSIEVLETSFIYWAYLAFVCTPDLGCRSRAA